MRRLLVVPCALALACACSKSQEKSGETAPPPPPVTSAKAGGPRITGKGFVVEVVPPEAAPAGAAATAKVVLRPTAGYHVNKEFPTLLKVTPPAGVECAKPEQSGADAKSLEEAGAEFEVVFTPAEPGDKAFEALFKFAVCTETTCDPKSEKLAWKVAVK